MARGSVVVTGAVSGIGRATALTLAEQGYDVIPTMRRDEPLPDPVQPPVLMDLGVPDSIQPACEQILDRADGNLVGLVNNAGVNVSGPFEVVSLDEWRHQFEVNLFGHLAVTKELLPALLGSRGRIVNVGSIGGRMSLPFLAPYSASKFAMRAWSDALRAELRQHGVRVALVEPGAIATPLWRRATGDAEQRVDAMSQAHQQRYAKQMQGAFRAAAMAENHAIPVERAAPVIAKALSARHPRGRYLVGPDARVQAAISILPTRAFDGVVSAIVRPPKR